MARIQCQTFYKPFWQNNFLIYKKMFLKQLMHLLISRDLDNFAKMDCWKIESWRFGGIKCHFCWSGEKK